MFLLITSLNPSTPHFVCEDPQQMICVDGQIFREVPPEGCDSFFLGFYDWLRLSDGRVVGVQIIFHDNRERPKQALASAKFGEWISNDIFQVTFSKAEIDPSLSVDQEFSTSRCYRSDTGAVALLFDASEITRGLACAQ